MAEAPIILGIANTSSLAWSASQIFVDELAAQLSRDAQHHLYFIVVGPELIPTALTASADLVGWSLVIAYGTLPDPKVFTVAVPKNAFPDASLSFDDTDRVLTLTPTAGTGQPRNVTVAEVVRAAINVEKAGTTTTPKANFPGLHMYFDAAKSTQIPETVTIVEQGQTAADGGEKQKDRVDTIVDEFFTFEVAYIGQSYGDNGSNKAIDRLTGNHKTVQKALSNIQDFSRNRSVGFITIDQQLKSVHTRIDTTQGSVDLPAIGKFLAARFIDLYEPLSKTTVNAAEAALISAFKPRWNIQLTNFPQSGAPKLVKELKKQGYTHLHVGIDLQDALVKLKGPKTAQPSPWHSWTFNLDTGDLEGPENVAWVKFNTRY